ncbi:MAG: hypothetical protein RR982_05260 [Kiritimatiellia bacterium]
MTAPNLYFLPDGRTALRYRTLQGAMRERVVAFPAQLLMAPPDLEAEVRPRVLNSVQEALFVAFREMPLNPHGAWALADEGFLPVFREVFNLLLNCLRCSAENRWCVRGEPSWFLQFGMREEDGYSVGAFVLPCGKPAVLTLRCADLIEALPPDRPITTMTIESVADGLPLESVSAMPWNMRVRLPIVDHGGACIKLHLIKHAAC